MAAQMVLVPWCQASQRRMSRSDGSYEPNSQKKSLAVSEGSPTTSIQSSTLPSVKSMRSRSSSSSS